jgi:hypothetical protein
MGKASSAKKVARVARAGGRASGVRQRNLLFPGAIGAVVLVGSLMVVGARLDHTDDAANVSPKIGEHWHSAYGFYICDNFIPTFPAQENQSAVGIHTHADGVIHIHPFSSGGAGENAKLGTFFKDAGIELSDSELKLGDQSWKEGEDKCGDKKGELVVARWKDVQNTTDKPSLIYENFDDLRFRENGEGYTIAFVPEGTIDIPKPPSAANLADLGAADAGQTSADQSTSTTAPGTESTDTTLPVDPNATTVPPDPNATTVPPDPNATTTVPGSP